MKKSNGPWLWRAAALSLSVSVVGAACAKAIELPSGMGGAGGSITGGDTSSGSGNNTSTSGSGGSIPAGEVGGPCDASGHCVDGATCTQVGNEKVCTVPCPPDCPAGTYCTLIQGDAVCVPDKDQQCDKCNTSADCAMPTDQCFKAPAGDTFCARDCTVTGFCPDGFTCVDGVTYQSGGQGDGPDGGTDGGNPPAGMPTKWCVPSGGASCPCNDKRDGVTHACHNKNNFGDCTGKEKCDGKAGTWGGCTAAAPADEACNNKDDNCNGMVDDGDGNVMCAAMGPKPPHGNWMCDMGTCKTGKCDAGWSAFPPGPPSAGCTCPLEAGEPNGTCNSVEMVGMVTDTGAPATFQGTLSAASDIDFWRIEVNDTPEAGTNSFHVSIDFSAPMPNDEFVMDVIQGDNCVAMPAGPSSGITAYDWCVDGSAGGETAGEAPCGEGANMTHCADHSAPYFIRVYRKLGANGTCTPYTVSVSAHGSGRPCDFSKKCPP
ncbi:MAG: hypothetical protein U0359_02175 [Byssovorax sp.]